MAKSVNLRRNAFMESITKNVCEISLPDKLELEHAIGQQLAENQQVTIQVCSVDHQIEPAIAETESAHWPSRMVQRLRWSNRRGSCRRRTSRIATSKLDEGD